MNTNESVNEISMELVMKGIQELLEAVGEQSELIRELKAKKFSKALEIEEVDKGSFNFPISSLTKLEGVGKLKLPDSILLTPNFVDPDILTFKGDFLQKPFHVLSSIRENTFCPAVSYVLKERVEKKVLYRNLMEFLFFFYEFDIGKSISFLGHLTYLLYDLYEFNISKFLFW